MSKRRVRSLRPETESLESRRVMSATFLGTDLDGDTYTLRLAGPGDLRVTTVDVAGDLADPADPALIDTITIAGTDPTTSRLVGRVRRGPGGDGRVFFQNLEQLGGPSENLPGNLGILAIDLPNFHLGITNPGPAAGASIDIPDGVVTLRFGGVDSTATFGRPGVLPPNQNNQNDQFTINLGLPLTQGTSVIVDRIVTSAQASTTTGGQPTQDSVTITVAGRLNEFRAGSIEGNAEFPSTGFQGGGGTLVVSVPDQATQIPGQIGFVRVNGNATNFAVQTSSRIRDVFIGGEANNVSILAPEAVRFLNFGRGMDTVTVRTDEIETIQANRGAINSSITVGRDIGNIIIGGDVVDTRVLAGYAQDLATAFQSQQAPDDPPPVQNGGTIGHVRIAGDVQDSVFAASVDSGDGVFGNEDDLVLPHGSISARVEGQILNAEDLTAEPDQAFFAHVVRLSGGPVTPPNVDEPPFPHADAPPSGRRIVRGLQRGGPALPINATPAAQTLAQARAERRRAARSR